MAKVKIILEKGESQEQAESDLVKALTFHSFGEAHTENFDDPAMADTLTKLQKLHETIYSEMIEQISEELDQDFHRGY